MIFRTPSPNHSARHESVTVLCMHATATAGVGSPLDWLRNPLSRVSAHYLISTNGDTYQLVPEDRVAWHAGISRWAGKWNVNERAIGIELVGLNRPDSTYPDAQYLAAVMLGRRIVARHGITWHNVITHAACAWPAGRKSDPRNFPMDEYRADLFLVPQPAPKYRARRQTWARTVPARRGPYAVVAQHTPLVFLGEVDGDVVNGSARWVKTDLGYIPAAEIEAL